jgi:hypothetical protein
MPFLHWFKRKSENTEIAHQTLPVEKSVSIPANAPEPVASQSPPESGPSTNQIEPADSPLTLFVDFEPATSEASASTEGPHLSVAIGAFYSKLPTHLLAPKTPDLARFVQIAEDDIVLDEEAEEATLPLSILSLSCPEIFTRAVDGSDDFPVTFYIGRPKGSEQQAAKTDDRPAETEAPLPPAEDTFAADLGGSDQEEIRLRLQPILTDFPPQLEPAAIDSLYGTQAEIALPMGLIHSQLRHGRVVIPAEIFCRLLPADLRPYFESIDPAAEIPIPLQEIFSRLPASAIELREDQEADDPGAPIPTPFTEQVEEDAKRFAQIPVEATAAANETPEPKDEPSRIAVENDSKKLQAIFLTDEPLDLVKTVQNVSGLPGLRSCLLSTTDGVKLAGSFGEPGQEQAILAVLPEVFGWTGSKLEPLQEGALETITFYYGLHQLSTFVQAKLCLTVLHDNRPFKPGVREKIRAVLNELTALSAPERTA